MNIDDLPKDAEAGAENVENSNAEETQFEYEELTAKDAGTDTEVEAAETAVEATEDTTEANEVTEAVQTEEIADATEAVTEEDSNAEETTSETDEPVEEKLNIADVISETDKAALPTIKQKKKGDEKRWYSLRVISGKEKKIKERIELEISRRKWADSVTQILVPSEKVYKIRNGKKVILERNILPGYILVEAIPDRFSGEMIQTISGMTNVIHFLGKTKPIPMQPSEANRMLGKVDESQEVGESMLEPFIVGETVKIIDGPFNDFVGDIKEVNEEKKKLKVIVKIFGRGTEVELNFMQVEKTS